MKPSDDFRLWSVSLRGQEVIHTVLARKFEVVDGWLYFIGSAPNDVVGRFCMQDVEGYWIEASNETITIG